MPQEIVRQQIVRPAMFTARKFVPREMFFLPRAALLRKKGHVHQKRHVRQKRHAPRDRYPQQDRYAQQDRYVRRRSCTQCAFEINLEPMRKLFQPLILALLPLAVVLVAALPSQAAQWTSYANKRFGVVADVPPGFAPVGPEADNSDGLIFRSHDGLALLTIFGSRVGTRGFEAHMAAAMAQDKSYSGWTIRNKTITPRWAEYSGSNGSRQLRVRTIAACKGRLALSVKIEFNGAMDAMVSRLFRSLRPGPANSCP